MRDGGGAEGSATFVGNQRLRLTTPKFIHRTFTGHFEWSGKPSGPYATPARIAATYASAVGGITSSPHIALRSHDCS